MTSERPLATHLIDEPGRFATLETWERFLTEVQLLPPSTARNETIKRARLIIGERRAAPKATN